MSTYYVIETEDTHVPQNEQETTEESISATQVSEYQEEESTELQAHQYSNKAEWTSEETKYMLQQYEMYVKQIGPLKRFKNKKLMWIRIAEEINDFFSLSRSWKQVENRYKTVLKRKKEAIENNNTSGSSRMDVPYDQELSKISALDDSIQPEILRSANNVRVGKRTKESSCSSNCSADTYDSGIKDKPRKPKLSVAQVLAETAKTKEENKDRRHREKMELLKQYLNIRD